MTIVEMLGQSGILTVLGMGVVFSFIVIMIIAMGLMQKLVHALKLDVAAEAVPAAATAAIPAAVKDDKALIAAIAAAVRGKQN
jgi:oxaloacetate decarboxylase gamma subunit